MSDTRNKTKDAIPAPMPTTSHGLDKTKIRVIDLMNTARQAFIKANLDKSTISDKLKIINEEAYLYTDIIDGKKYRVFGVRHDKQEKINFAKFRQQIANELELKDVEGSVQIIGDSSCFSQAGTDFARKELHKTLNGNKKSIFYYGFTGNVLEDGKFTDANHLVSEYLDDKIHGVERAQRFIANVVDKHTITAIKEWKCSISENICNLMLVYSGSKEPAVEFGGDTALDSLTTKKATCLDGGVQSLLQIFNMLDNDVEIEGVCQLRSSEKIDPDSKKPYLSASHFVSFLKESIAKLSAEPTVEDIDRLIKLFLQKYESFNRGKKDADTKKPLWDAAMKKLFEKQLWKKFNLFKLKEAPQITEELRLKKESNYLTRTPQHSFAVTAGLFALGFVGAAVLKGIFSSPQPDSFKPKSN